EGLYVEGPAGLGMRRLSIIDVAGGHQPVHNEDRTVWVVFNGEIYNFRSLRRELEGRGHHFYTYTDTEVIVHLYEEHGSGCVQKLRGMFAFAVYDEKNRCVLLARDRLGIKPLHYANDGARLLFGSEIKVILAAAPELKEIQPESLLQYFYFGYIPEPATVFRKIRKLPPGCLMEWKNGRGKVQRYWDLPAYGSSASTSEEECLEELERRLEEAVKIRLIAEVPLGALLSGGVDSSIVVALMARSTSSPVKTFSIGFSKRDFDEAPYARQVAERFGTEHHELMVQPDIGEALDRLTRSLEEPFGDSSMIPTYYISRLARQHVTVALSGDGGDELFAGYGRYALALRGGFADHVPPFLGRWYRNYVHPLISRGAYGRNFVYNRSLPFRDRYLDSMSWLPAYSRDQSVFSRDFLASAKKTPHPLANFRQYFDHAPAKDPLSRLLYLDTKTYLPGDILTKVDRMSMLCSLEARVPLLDHEFVECVTRLPVAWKFQDGEQKHILKRLAERVGVPRDVIYRPKRGFALPLVHWMKHEFRKELPRLLLDPRTLQRGYFDPKVIEETLDEHFSGRRDHSGRIWGLLILELWHRNFLENVPSGRPDLSIRLGQSAGESSKVPVARC
ncbi:MAG TPA: asparagine synthase (glutamine-hydrolyzing), partial [Terriglobia bacterium]|nr:asparagine synthase (glutamine-hydrolyzing) [Terriglobia bacterium]